MTCGEHLLEEAGKFSTRGTSDGDLTVQVFPWVYKIVIIDMDVMEATEATLQTKLIQLRITVERTSAILESGKIDAIQRQQDALKAIATEADHGRMTVEAQKIAAKQRLSRY